MIHELCKREVVKMLRDRAARLRDNRLADVGIALGYDRAADAVAEMPAVIYEAAMSPEEVAEARTELFTLRQRVEMEVEHNRNLRATLDLTEAHLVRAEKLLWELYDDWLRYPSIREKVYAFLTRVKE